MARDPLQPELQALVSQITWCWEQNLYPPQEQQVLLIAEPFSNPYLLAL